MYATDNFAIFTATDSDGDELSVEGDDAKHLIFTVAGEDGHRSVVLSYTDAARLAEVIRQKLIVHGD